MFKWGAISWHFLLSFKRSLLRGVFALTAVGVFSCLNFDANAVTATEGKLRAAVIVGIMRFTSWPDTPEFAQAKEINVCLKGEPTSQDFLIPISGQRRVLGKSIVVKKVDDADLTNCQVLVIGDSVARKAIRPLLLQADQGAMLSVCDGCREEFSEEPIINLTLRHKKVKFQVNLARAKESGLMLDAQLLELALSVRKE